MARPKTIKKSETFVIPYTECPAKTFIRPDGTVGVGRTAPEHMKIVGTVAQSLIDRVSTSKTRDLYPEGTPLATAVHDLGKVSPTFAAKLYHYFSDKNPQWSDLLKEDYKRESAWGGHAGVSFVTLSDPSIQSPPYVPQIAARHHGYMPPSYVNATLSSDRNYGGQEWHEQRVALLADLKNHFGTGLPTVRDADQAQLLAGLTTVADWIGSSSWFEDPSIDWRNRIESSLDNAGFVSPVLKSGLTFEEVFGFSPRESQVKLIESVTGPGVYVLEVTMGEGKTEAGLYAAYKMLEQGYASGIYFALPTQLTSNKLYERFNPFLDKILDEKSAHNALLVHSGAWLVDTEIGEEGRPGYSWFDSKKRSLLAPFAVGTVDQALMSVMNVKHGFVRSFGLAGKVVILDEIHTYDAYTGLLIDELIRHLRALNCTVILLSATLQKQRRETMLKSALTRDDYPLVTALPNQGDLAENPITPPDDKQVEILLQKDERAVMSEAIDRACRGEQVLWIENTVDDAQSTYKSFAALGFEVGLLHSRFIPIDRESNESRWVAAFGKAGWGERGTRGRILVGTQVLEQSLDIDADFLVTAFAPTDMLLQRLGRLWRHEGTPRAPGATRTAWVIAPSIKTALENPIKAFKKSAFVYSQYVLCRSLEVWECYNAVNLPSDVRPMIDATYRDREEQGMFQQLHYELVNGNRNRTGQRTMEQLARLTINLEGGEQPDDQPSTRYSDTESLELLLVRQFITDPNTGTDILVMLDGSRIKLSSRGLKNNFRRHQREVATILAKNIVKVPASLNLKRNTCAELRELGLHRFVYVGKPNNPSMDSPLTLGFVDEKGRVDTGGGVSVSHNRIVEYRAESGLSCIET